MYRCFFRDENIRFRGDNGGKEVLKFMVKKEGASFVDDLENRFDI